MRDLTVAPDRTLWLPSARPGGLSVARLSVGAVFLPPDGCRSGFLNAARASYSLSQSAPRSLWWSGVTRSSVSRLSRQSSPSCQPSCSGYGMTSRPPTRSMICSGVSVRCDSVEKEGLGWPDFGVSWRTLQSAVDDAVLKLLVREKADEAHVWYRGLSLVVAERLRLKQHICAECRSLGIRNVQSWRAWRASRLHSGVVESLRVCCQRATLNETIRPIRKVAQYMARASSPGAAFWAVS